MARPDTPILSMERSEVEELQALYSELHITCERAAASLRLSVTPGAPTEELLERFRAEEAHASAIWQRIRAIQRWE